MDAIDIEMAAVQQQQQQQQQQQPIQDDRRLLEAAEAGQTDLILQLLEENGADLHNFKDQVSFWGKAGVLARIQISRPQKSESCWVHKTGGGRKIMVAHAL